MFSKKDGNQIERTNEVEKGMTKIKFLTTEKKINLAFSVAEL